MAVVERERINYSAPTDQAGGGEDLRDSLLKEITSLIPSDEAVKADPSLASKRVNLGKWRRYLNPERRKEIDGEADASQRALDSIAEDMAIAKDEGADTKELEERLTAARERQAKALGAKPEELRGKAAGEASASGAKAEAGKSPYDRLTEKLILAANDESVDREPLLREIASLIPSDEAVKADPLLARKRADLSKWKRYLNPERRKEIDYHIKLSQSLLDSKAEDMEIAKDEGVDTKELEGSLTKARERLAEALGAKPEALRAGSAGETKAEEPKKGPYDELVEKLTAYVTGGKPAAEAPKAQAPREVPGTESEEDHLKRLQKEIGEGSWKIAPGIRGKNLIDELVFYLSHGGTIDLTNSSLFDASKNLYLTPVAQDFIRECVQRAQEIIETKTEQGRASNGESAQAGAAQAPAAEQRQGSEFAGLREKLNEDNWWVMSGIEDALRKMVEAEGVIIDISKIKLPADETLKGIITARINDINESARARAEAGAAPASDTGERNEEERGNDSGKLSWWERARRRVLGNRTENAPESMYKDVEYKNPDGTAMDEGQTRAIQAKVRAIASREDFSQVSPEDLELVERYLNLDAINPVIRKKIQAALKK